MHIVVRNPALPERAGKARIEYRDPHRMSPWRNNYATEVDPSALLPTRQGDLISLPSYPTAQVVTLARGQQFIYSIEDRLVYFGGTDEEPFLVRLDPRAIQRGNNGVTEDDFYGRLVPGRVRFIEKALGVRHKRQGDIFAVPVRINRKTMNVLGVLEASSSQPGVGTKELAKVPVFETRHQITGVGVTMQNFHGLGQTILVEGTIEAPDHAPLELKQPHILDQTLFLFDPRIAD